MPILENFIERQVSSPEDFEDLRESSRVNGINEIEA